MRVAGAARPRRRRLRAVYSTAIQGELQISIPCNLCRSTDAEPVRFRDRHGRSLRSVICRSCGLVWTDPRPTAERVRDFYASEYRLEYKGVFRPRPAHTFRAGKAALNRLELLGTILRPGARILDIGAGGGEFVYVAGARGYQASGIEPNRGFAAYAAEALAVRVSEGTYQTAPIAPQSHDVVTMFHTVEHLEDPFGAMQRARGWLVPDGVLVIEVPNVEARCHQPHQQFHRGHLYHFNLATLERTGLRAGYDIVASGTSPDGGNIWTIFRKSAAVAPHAADLPGNYDRVRSILRRHTPMRHALSLHPYLRPLKKLSARVDEWLHVRSSDPRAVLDQLIASR